MIYVAAALAPDPSLQCARCSGLGLLSVREPGVPEWAWRSAICGCFDGRVRCQTCGDAAAEVVEPDGTASCLPCSAPVMVDRAPALAAPAEVIPLRKAYARIYRESRPAGGKNGRRVRVSGSRT